MTSVPSSSSSDRDQLTPLGPPPSGEAISVIASETLFAGRNEIRVRHRGQEYRLRITRQGKLILTK
jgi:hemin uptake protein HemP